VQQEERGPQREVPIQKEMRSLDNFIVFIEKRFNDTVTLSNGHELYVDTKFNEFKHRVNEGVIVNVPYKYDGGAKKGDTLYFHHLVVINDGQILADIKDHYLVKYQKKETINSQCIAYKCSETGDIHPMSGWAVLEAVHEEPKLKSDIIELVVLEEPLPTKGSVAFLSQELEDLGLKVGDHVGFRKNMDYRFKIDGKEYYRTRTEDLLYVEI
jgi:co-chaperonin GroES (HSP10)